MPPLRSIAIPAFLFSLVTACASGGGRTPDPEVVPTFEEALATDGASLAAGGAATLELHATHPRWDLTLGELVVTAGDGVTASLVTRTSSLAIVSLVASPTAIAGPRALEVEVTAGDETLATATLEAAVTVEARTVPSIVEAEPTPVTVAAGADGALVEVEGMRAGVWTVRTDVDAWIALVSREAGLAGPVRSALGTELVAIAEPDDMLYVASLDDPGLARTIVVTARPVDLTEASEELDDGSTRTVAGATLLTGTLSESDIDRFVVPASGELVVAVLPAAGETVLPDGTYAVAITPDGPVDVVATDPSGPPAALLAVVPGVTGDVEVELGGTSGSAPSGYRLVLFSR
jgi:hypothetical protein